jgi:tRNA modification GTPase
VSTVFALSSGRGRAAIAVVRVTGPRAGTALAALADALPPPRAAKPSRLTAVDGRAIDAALVLWFPGPASATGEDVAEFHVHGGPAVVECLLTELGALPGLIPAEPGEFTRRAFQNGKLDLTQVEALADTIAAETEAQRVQAVRQLEGELGRLVEYWREEVLRALAHVEAAIDFAEDDLPADVAAAAEARVRRLIPQMDKSVHDAVRGECLRGGVQAVLLGAPNVGKSSVFNRLARRDAAIVSPTAGTTRDVVEVHLDLSGAPLLLADTAGLREIGDQIEGEGMRRAVARAEDADLKLALFDATAWPVTDAATRAHVDGKTVIVVNKTDLVGGPPPGSAILDGRPVRFVSARTGAGFEELLALLETEVAARTGLTEEPGLSRARHREALAASAGHLRGFLEDAAAPLELRAEELRLAARALGRITGRVGVEDMLDFVFSEFCIGK